MLKLTTPAMDQFMHSLPLAEYDMAWTLFFITGFVLGFIWHKAADKAPATAESIKCILFQISKILLKYIQYSL